MSRPGAMGLDVGTSGCRAVAIDERGHILAETNGALPAPIRSATGAIEQHPALWWERVVDVLGQIARRPLPCPPEALCVDATSSTLLLCTPEGSPLGPALMYNDGSSRREATRIAALAPVDSPARGASSSLAKLLRLKARLAPKTATLALHQADWITGRLLGQFGTSDWNNALKLGFDAAGACWPEWIARLDLAPVVLPRCHRPGARLGPIDAAVADATGLPRGLQICAGTTDSTAAVLAAGVAEPGDAVTSLGSSLVLKILSPHPIGDPGSGVYSHRLGRLWLAGGASNSGGAVLRQFFTDRRIAELSAGIDPATPAGLDYYPLPDIGERFPRNDPAMLPRLAPRPQDDRRFLQGLFEGIAAIEAAGYRRLTELGAPRPRRVVTIGGGARNAVWTAIRQRRLGIPVGPAHQQQAAYGAARLALGAVGQEGQTGGGPID